jgi:hypothetical protein
MNVQDPCKVCRQKVCIKKKTTVVLQTTVSLVELGVLKRPPGTIWALTSFCFEYVDWGPWLNATAASRSHFGPHKLLYRISCHREFFL